MSEPPISPCGGADGAVPRDVAMLKHGFCDTGQYFFFHCQDLSSRFFCRRARERERVCVCAWVTTSYAEGFSVLGTHSEHFFFFFFLFPCRYSRHVILPLVVVVLAFPR